MKINRVAVSLLVIVLFAVCLLVVPGAQDSKRGLEMNLLKSVELRSQRVIPLAQEARLILPEGKNEQKQVPVMLVEMEYDCRLLVLAEDGQRERCRCLLCYEIRSKGDRPFSWAMWSFYGLGRFRLFPKTNGKNMLAWIQASSICFTEVSEPKDRLVELTRFLSRQRPPRFQHVPVGSLVPEAKTWGVNALYFDICVRSIEKDDAGKIIVTFSGPDSERIYTVVRDGGEWQRK